MTYHNRFVLENFLKNGNITRYAYILHDQDDCENHYHFLIVSKSNISSNYIANNLDSIAGIHQNTFCEPLRDKSAMFKYLTHEQVDGKNKFVYDESRIVTNDKNYFLDLDICEDNKAYSILMDLINNVSYRDLAKRYGREIIINYDRYNSFAQLIRSQELTLKLKVVDCDEKDLPF